MAFSILYLAIFLSSFAPGEAEFSNAKFAEEEEGGEARSVFTSGGQGRNSIAQMNIQLASQLSCYRVAVPLY